MLWPVVKPPQSALYWLDDVHKGFYRSMFAGNVFADCFPQTFRPVLQESAKTREKFQGVYDSYNRLTPQLKLEFNSLFYNQVQWLQYLDNAGHVILQPRAAMANIWGDVKALGAYLYSTTLDLVCYKNSAPNPADSMDSHYAHFKTSNGIICCFCGTEEMMEEREIELADGADVTDEKQWRASYDHYLPKKHYPFLAVDFDNLIPCCQKCNEKAKGELDVLNCDGVRTLAFNPYTDHEPASLIASYEPNNGTFLMRIDIADTRDQRFEKADTWNRTFKVLSRINQRLNRFNASWLAPILNKIPDADTARTKLLDEVTRCRASMKNEREAYFKALCFETVANKSDDDFDSFLETVEQVYGRRRV